MGCTLGKGDIPPFPEQETDLHTSESDFSGMTLDRAAMGETFIVTGVSAPEGAPEWGPWLEEIGFVSGEKVRLMAKAFPGGDPVVVRVGQSTFALRLAEAACIAVTPAVSSAEAGLLDHMAVEGRKS